jgi:hypothetical protein
MLARGRDHVGILSAVTRGDLARCERRRDLGVASGMGDELRAAIVDEHGCWGSFELFRSSDQPAFDADDAQLMRDAARILAPALRRGFVTPTADGAAISNQTGVLLIDERYTYWASPRQRERGCRCSAPDRSRSTRRYRSISTRSNRCSPSSASIAAVSSSRGYSASGLTPTGPTSLPSALVQRRWKQARDGNESPFCIGTHRSRPANRSDIARR